MADDKVLKTLVTESWSQVMGEIVLTLPCYLKIPKADRGIVNALKMHASEIRGRSLVVSRYDMKTGELTSHHFDTETDDEILFITRNGCTDLDMAGGPWRIDDFVRFDEDEYPAAGPGTLPKGQ